MPINKEAFNIISPRDAVADAMTSAQETHLIQIELGMEKGKIRKNADIVVLVNSKSVADCFASCKQVIKHLSNYPDLIQYIAIVGGAYTNFFRYHGVFVTLGNDKIWYAGSPANNTPQMPRFSKLYLSENLGTVMSQIKLDEGGIWPTEDEIIQKFEENPDKYKPAKDPNFFEYLIEVDRNIPPPVEN